VSGHVQVPALGARGVSVRNRDQLLVVPCGTLNHYIKSIDRFSIETHGDLGIHHQMVIMGFIKKTSIIMVSIVIMGSYGL
jgi:hypothetical protein